jgi:hypothetical protein
MTKTMLHQEWAMTLDQAIEAEAQAQAICMQTRTSPPMKHLPPGSNRCHGRLSPAPQVRAERPCT